MNSIPAKTRRIVELLEAEHRLNSRLDASVILFHDVVQVLD
jgi:hypothetical protein